MRLACVRRFQNSIPLNALEAILFFASFRSFRQWSCILWDWPKEAKKDEESFAVRSFVSNSNQKRCLWLVPVSFVQVCRTTLAKRFCFFAPFRSFRQSTYWFFAPEYCVPSFRTENIWWIADLAKNGNLRLPAYNEYCPRQWELLRSTLRSRQGSILSQWN